MGHHCHAVGCETPTPPSLLFCKPHWFMVPMRLRTAVLRAFNPAQCRQGPRPLPSVEWLRAANAARVYVARAEGKHEAADRLEAFAAKRLREEDVA